jgi:hypothetical protein
MLTKEKVTGHGVLAAAAVVPFWPDGAIWAVGAFFALTLAMLLIDKPEGALFAAPFVNDDGDESSNWMHWHVQPMWVKAFTTRIGYPAWLLLVGKIGQGPSFDVEPLLIAAFAATAVLQMVFVARAYWRMDI